jgi:hypothetical protein
MLENAFARLIPIRKQAIVKKPDFSKETLFPDLSPQESWVKINEGAHPKQNLVDDMATLVHNFDIALNTNVPKEAFTILSRPETVRRQRDEFTDRLTSLKGLISFANIETVFAFPMSGARPLMYEFARRQKESEGIFPVWIGGTEGTSTGEAQIKKNLPEDLLRPESIVVFADDVTDTFVTSLQLAHRRLEKSNADPDLPYTGRKNDLEMIQKLKKAKIPFNSEEYTQYYENAAKTYHEAGVVIAPLYNKNAHMTNILKTYASELQAKERKNVWAIAQLAALDIPENRQYSENQWLMGAGVLDTGIKGSEILERLKTQKETELAEILRASGMSDLELRIGATGLESLVEFNGDYRNDLVQRIADWVRVYYKGE